MMRLFAAFLAGAAALLAACNGPDSTQVNGSGGAAVAGEGPALWRIADADTTVYLFGTVHVLPPDLAWRTPQLDSAFNEAKAVYFETDIQPDPVALQRLVMQLGVYTPPDRLSNHLSAEDFQELSKLSARLSLPVAAIESMKPWFAAMTLSEQIITGAGYDPLSGVERVIGPEARDAGKQIRKFETIEEQLRVFADLPQDVQIRYLMEGVRQIEDEMVLLDELVQAWARGDVDALDRIMIENDLAEMPEVYEALLVRRNRNWVDAIETLMSDEAGVFLIAVGAAHLAGEDSVQVMLEDRGRSVVRIN